MYLFHKYSSENKIRLWSFGDSDTILPLTFLIIRIQDVHAANSALESELNNKIITSLHQAR